MARFDNPVSSGSSTDTYDKLYVTHNSDGENVKIGDDAWIGDVDAANHIAIIGVEDSTKGGVIFGDTLNEKIYSDATDLVLESGNDIVLYPGSNYAYLNDIVDTQRIAVMADISPLSGQEASFTVNGGSLGTMPTFNGAPLFSGSYVKTGKLVHFQIQVDMDNITSFGTGQYYVDLPFDAKYNYLFRNACLHDVSMPRQYGLSGHVEAGQSRMLLFYTDTSGQDYAFDYNSPALLTVNDNFHISGEYIAE